MVTGALNETSRSSGGLTRSGVIGADGADGALVPALFVAVTVNVYGVPLAKPKTLTGEDVPLTGPLPGGGFAYTS